MASNERLEQIVARVAARGFLSVRELADACHVSEVTIRRDLEALENAGRLRRTYGGAVPMPQRAIQPAAADASGAGVIVPSSLADRVDVLITTPVDPDLDRALLDRAGKRGVPVIAESVNIAGARTLVALDNFAAGVALGRWAGAYAREHFGGQANVLDLTYLLSNTQARSQGFIAGLRELLPGARLVLSINGGSARSSAYQLTQAALDVHPEINLIFGINDITAWGAIQACADRGVAPGALVVLPFGLEGDTLRTSLMGCDYCRAGLAMFPEIVGPVCIEAAILAHNDRPLPAQLLTPHGVLTPDNLAQYYIKADRGWELNWETIGRNLSIPLPINGGRLSRGIKLPRRIGFVVPFSEHEWYKTLVSCMLTYAAGLGIDLEVIDAEQNRRDDLAMREREIAAVAATRVAAGDVILLDAGQVTAYLAEALGDKENITVITNSVPVFESLRGRPAITLILTGGVFRQDSGALSGPTAQMSLRELRADKLFLTASGITPEFGLSHTNLAEVAMKQAMIRAAREVIVLADHTKFGQESIAQVAPLPVVNQVITDNALPAETRLELSKSGIEVIIAPT
jgi:DeoR/GlpR family transcriptional regulator of sugar metabolism